MIVKIDEKLGLDQGKIPHERHPALGRHDAVPDKRPGAGKGQVRAISR
ncbi:MAG: hypothetical protein MZV64_17675 [Ignavibacteriales bacterium]|nr:hypothetical protein [Ignavibacteriales bacterium]